MRKTHVGYQTLSIALTIFALITTACGGGKAEIGDTSGQPDMAGGGISMERSF